MSSFWKDWLRFGYGALFQNEEEEGCVQVALLLVPGWNCSQMPDWPLSWCPFFEFPVRDGGSPHRGWCPSQEPVFSPSGLFRLQRQVQGSHSSGPFVLYRHHINVWQSTGAALSAFTSLGLELTPRLLHLWWPERFKTQLYYQWNATFAFQALKSLEGLVRGCTASVFCQ